MLDSSVKVFHDSIIGNPLSSCHTCVLGEGRKKQLWLGQVAHREKLDVANIVGKEESKQARASRRGQAEGGKQKGARRRGHAEGGKQIVVAAQINSFAYRAPPDD
jgi:hypothetical protein